MRYKLDLTEKEKTELLRNSIDRVMDMTQAMLLDPSSYPEERVIVNADDWEILRPIVSKLWHWQGNEIREDDAERSAG